jgi:hypothetical protein
LPGATVVKHHIGNLDDRITTTIATGVECLVGGGGRAGQSSCGVNRSSRLLVEKGPG